MGGSCAELSRRWSKDGVDVAMALNKRVSQGRRLPCLKERVGVVDAEGCPRNKNVAGASMDGRSDLGGEFQVGKLQLSQEQ